MQRVFGDNRTGVDVIEIRMDRLLERAHQLLGEDGGE